MPRREAHTAAAQAPVPQAKVGPTPRSQTLTLMDIEFSTLTNSILAWAGQIGWHSRMGPIFSKSTSSRLWTNTTPWGLPIDTGCISQELLRTSTVWAPALL